MSTTNPYKIDDRPFKKRIIHGLGYREKDAIKLLSEPKECTTDYGALMPIQGFTINTTLDGTFKYRNADIECLNTWSDHYRSCNVPFLVVRTNSEQVKIYKRRVVADDTALWRGWAREG